MRSISTLEPLGRADAVESMAEEVLDDQFAMEGMPRVLIVDDEISYREALASGLRREGFRVTVVGDGQSALASFQAELPDIVLLDCMLPDTRGFEVCSKMRRLSNVPIIMVTARSAEVDVVLALELGATDYVTKPFRLRVLVARIRAILRRETVEVASGEVVHVAGPLRVDTSRREVFLNDVEVELSKKEFDLLALLVANIGNVVTRDRCIDELWYDRDLSDSRTLDTHVRRLRHKIEKDPAKPAHLITIRGVGFRFQA